MLKHLKSTLASLLAAVLLVSALAVPVAADTGAVKDTSFNHDIDCLLYTSDAADE